MKAVSYQIHVDAPTEKVWNILADFGGVYRYSPGVRSSHSTSQVNGGVGATRHCDLLPAGSVEERIVEWTEGQSYTLEIYEGKGTPPFKHAVATLKLKPEAGGTRVFASLDYSLKYGPVGAVMDKVMVQRFLDKGFQGLLSGLKHHAETGEEVESTSGIQFVAVPA